MSPTSCQTAPQRFLTLIIFLSFVTLLDKVGFEPTTVLPVSAFKTAALDHSATYPKLKNLEMEGFEPSSLFVR